MKSLRIFLAAELLLTSFVVVAAQMVPSTPAEAFDGLGGYAQNGENVSIQDTRQESSRKIFSVTFIHTNDVHSRVDEFDRYQTDCSPAEKAANACFGGVARQKTIIDRIRKESGHPTVLVDAGDQFQGTAYYTHYKGNLTSEIMNRLKYNAMALGNHEFDDGIPNLERVASKFNFPLVCANADFSGFPQFRKLVKPYVIMKDLSLGIIGFITPLAGEISNAGNGVKFLSPIPIVQKYVDELKGMGINRIVALSHNGYLSDQETAAAVSGLNLIIGGHSHTVLDRQGPAAAGLMGYYPTNVTNAEGKSTFVVQVGYAGRYIGNITLSWNEEDELVDISGTSILLDSSVPKDPELDKFAREMRKPFEVRLSQVLGTSTAGWNHTECLFWKGECALGNLINDAILEYYSQIDLSITNAGGIRASLHPGPITLGDALTIFPFGNYVVSTLVTGQYILDILENVFARQNKVTGKPIPYPAVFGGCRVTIDSSRPAFQRVLSVEIRDKKVVPPVFTPLRPENVYLLGTSNFLAVHGDCILPEPMSSFNKHLSLADIVAHYIKDNSTITPYMDDRFVDISPDQSDDQFPCYEREGCLTFLPLALRKALCCNL